MDASNSENMCIPKTGEELIRVQLQLQSEIELLTAENENLNNLINSTEELCDINDADWVFEEKSILIDKLNQIEMCETVIPETKPEMFLILLTTLKNDLKLQLEAQEVVEEQISNSETKLQDAQALVFAHKQYLKFIEMKIPRVVNIEEQDAQAKRDFVSYRKQLHGILDRHFGDTNLKGLVQDLTVAYFEGEDKYVDASKKYTFNDVEILRQTMLTLSQPDDKMKIKFLNFK